MVGGIDDGVGDVVVLAAFDETRVGTGDEEGGEEILPGGNAFGHVEPDQFVGWRIGIRGFCEICDEIDLSETSPHCVGAVRASRHDVTE